MRRIVPVLLAIVLLPSCRSEPTEEKVSHPSAITNSTWLRSDYNVIGRELKEFDDHSGSYILITLTHGDKKITAECGSTWTTETGEDLPSTRIPYDQCGDLPMGNVKLDRTDWNDLYYFSGSGKHREEITLHVKKIETTQWRVN